MIHLSDIDVSAKFYEFPSLPFQDIKEPEDQWSCNADLTPCPGSGIYFNAIIHIYSPIAGADNPLGTNFDVNRKPLSLCPFVASFKTISTRFFMFFHMYIAPGRGRQYIGDKILMTTERPFLFAHMLQVSKWSLRNLIFNDFIHVYSPGQGEYNPLGINIWCQQKALITLPICCKFKKRKLILYTFLMIFYMYIAQGQGQTDNPLGTSVWCQQKAIITLPICCRFKKIALKSDFIYIFFMFHHMYIAPGRGRQSTGDKIFMKTERPYHFAQMLQVSKWSLWKLILYTYLLILYMYIAPGQGQKTPWGQTFYVNRMPLSLQPFVASFKQIFLNSDFLHIFNVFPHVYSPRAGADNPLWTKSWCQQKSLVTWPICCKFQKNIFEVWFYT